MIPLGAAKEINLKNGNGNGNGVHANGAISEDARTIIEAGLSAIDQYADAALGQVDQAVEAAVGKVFRRYSGTGRSEGGPVDALREIAVLYVYEKAKRLPTAEHPE